MSNEFDSVLGTQYDIQEKMLEISKVYFGADEETAKAGFLGYQKEVLAHFIKQAIFQKNTLYNEYFFNTASFPSSIYNTAASRNIEVASAVPSKAVIIVGMLMTDVFEKATVTGAANRQLYLNRDTNFVLLDTFRFMLPYSVNINITGTIDAPSVTAQFDISEPGISEEMTTIYTQAPFIKTLVQTTSDGRYLMLLLDFYQISLEEKVFEILSDNLSEKVYFNIQYTDSLVDFNISYKDSTGEQVLPKYMNNSAASSSSDKVVFYDHVDEDEYQIYFPVADNQFRPKFGSVLTAKTYTSKGAEGNFTYSGTVVFVSQEDQYENMTVVASISVNPAGGSDRPTIKEIKQSIFKSIKNSDALATEDDLNEFFSTITTQNFQNNSRVKFVSTRDDILRREFNAFVLMTDESGIPIPTNTVKVEAIIEDLQARNMTIKTGSIVVYDPTVEAYRLLRQTEFPDSFIASNKTTFVYALPYLTRIAFNPYLRMTYYNNFVNEKISAYYKDLNDEVPTEFIVNLVEAQRNPVFSNILKVSCAVGTAITWEGTPPFKLIAMLREPKTTKAYGYVDMTYSSINEQFEMNLEVEDEFNTDGYLIIRDSIRHLETGSLIPSLGLPESVTMEIMIVYDDGTDTSGPFNDDWALIPGLDGYKYVSTLNLEKKLTIYSTLDDLIRSDVFISNAGLVKMTAVPLIGATSYFNTNRYGTLINKFNTYVDILRTNFKKLRNNTDVNMKFFNTYGVSYLYNISTVNLAIDLNIKLYSYSKDVDTKIRKHIVDFVRASNDTVDGIFSVSNLITSLEKTFSQIRYITFNSLNGMNLQEVKLINSSSSEQEYEYPPECLSIGYTRRNPDLGQEDIPDITINYV